jgi:HK97 family phage prohead protease
MRRAAPTVGQCRAERVERDGKEFLSLDGNASTYEQGYEMWDWAGPYSEVVSERAGAQSLAAQPDVVFLLNHTGIPFARTKSGTLSLSEPGGVLRSEALLNPARQDARDLHQSVADGATTEMSFAFRIDQGTWSPDYTEYRISSFDIDRGDTSAVTYGANPNTSIEARAQRFALTNDLVRMAPALARSERELLADALHAVAPDEAGEIRTWRLGERAAKDLRDIRASVADGSQIDSQARSTLVAVLDDLTNGTGRLQATDGPLATLLGVTTPPVVERVRPARLDFLEMELGALRTLS